MDSIPTDHNCVQAIGQIQSGVADSLCSFSKSATEFDQVRGSASLMSPQPVLLVVKFSCFVELALLQVIRYKRFEPKAKVKPQKPIH